MFNLLTLLGTVCLVSLSGAGLDGFKINVNHAANFSMLVYVAAQLLL
jgi:hypothetical protein